MVLRFLTFDSENNRLLQGNLLLDVEKQIEKKMRQSHTAILEKLYLVSQYRKTDLLLGGSHCIGGQIPSNKYLGNEIRISRDNQICTQKLLY